MQRGGYPPWRANDKHPRATSDSIVSEATMKISIILSIVCFSIASGIFLFPFLQHDWVGTIKGLAWLLGIFLFASASIILFSAAN